LVFSNKIKTLFGFLFCEECLNKIDQNDQCLAGHFSVYNNNLLNMSNDLQNVLSLIHNYFMFHKKFTEEYARDYNLVNEIIW